MEDSLAQKAISLALTGNWKEAVDTNKQILRENPKDVDALNRLARAYSELGNLNLAKQFCQKVLKIDPINVIAEKSLVRWKSLRGKAKHGAALVTSEAFLEEPGKTKLIDLLHPGPVSVLAKLDAGDEVKMATHPHRVNVTTTENEYVGRLPDDLAARLKRLMSAGYQYSVVVKSINNKDIKIFVREILKPEGSKETSSFPPEKIEYASFTPPELVHKKEELIMQEEGES